MEVFLVEKTLYVKYATMPMLPNISSSSLASLLRLILYLRRHNV